MIINLSLILGHCFIIVLIYCTSWLFYRYIARPNLRWSQKGNICYDYARSTSIVITIVVVIILYALIHFDIKIIW